MSYLRAFAASAALAAATIAAPAHAEEDLLSRMFTWWNAAFIADKPFERAGFAQYWADDAVLRIDGVAVATGLDAITAHFRRIQSNVDRVEIVLPFAESMQGKAASGGDRIYTYHIIRSRRGKEAQCMLAAGHADLVGGKIKEVALARTVIQPGSSPVAEACWKSE